MKRFAAIFSLLAIVHGKCPPGAIQGLADDDCFTLGQSLVGWFDAEEECVRQNGHLASIDSAFLNAFLIDNTNPLITIIWLGGVADGAPARWRWTDRTPFLYMNWAKNEPESPACLAIHTSDGQWYSQYCSAHNSPLCKVPPVGDKAAPTCAPSKIRLACPSGWTYFDVTDKCYKSYDDRPRTWPEAEQLCVSGGGRLASIHSPEEQEFIKEITRTGLPAVDWTTNGVWIGLSDVKLRGVFKWADGTHLNYTSWAPSRPQSGSSLSYGIYYPDYFVDVADTGYDHWDNCVPPTPDDPACKVRGAVCKTDALR